MSERERWVVYPLLFLTLGIAIRDKMLKRVDTDAMIADRVISAPLTLSNTLQADEVVCGRLVVRSRSGRPAVTIGEDAKTRSGRIETYNGRGQITGGVGLPEARIIPKWLLPQGLWPPGGDERSQRSQTPPNPAAPRYKTIEPENPPQPRPDDSPLE